MEFQHFSHEHKLTFLELSQLKDELTVYCDGCDEVISDSAYFCVLDGCSLYALHKSCTELNRKITHPLHQHPLTLYEGTGKFCAFICDGCGYYSEGFAFNCRQCQFNLDVKCATKVHDGQVLKEWEKQVFVKHFSHLHILSLCNLRGLIKIACRCCNKIIQGFAYCCIPCEFFVHVSCMENMPTKIRNHPFHPEHKLLRTIPMDMGEVTNCEACNKRITGIRLNCTRCYFSLHVSCINPSMYIRTLKHKSHKHPLQYVAYMPPPHSLYCNSCHNECCNSFYRCVECNLALHIECIPLPRVVKHDLYHPHPLTLCSSLEEYEEFGCDVWEEKGDAKRHVYYCDECEFIAHIGCVISKDTASKTEKQDDLSVFLKNDVSEIKTYGGGLRFDENMKIKLHPHYLTCKPLNLVCPGCIRHHILDEPAYFCPMCQNEPQNLSADHLVHDQITYPPHQHPFTLLFKNREPPFLCNACGDILIGFDFNCSVCSLTLDVKCASLLDDFFPRHDGKTVKATVSHFIHEHSLDLCNLSQRHRAFCACCRLQILGSAYCCVECKFFIHEYCMDMPRYIRHPFHRAHGFLFPSFVGKDKMTREFMIRGPLNREFLDSSNHVEDNTTRSNGCGEPITGVGFKCSSCEFKLHVSCANKPIPRFLYLSEVHQHNLFYYVAGESSRYLPCPICNANIWGPFYRSPECDISVHGHCLVDSLRVEEHQCHLHTLTLLYFSIEDDSKEHCCDICKKQRNSEEHVYFRQECNFFAHIECVFSKPKNDTLLEMNSNFNCIDDKEQHRDAVDRIDGLQEVNTEKEQDCTEQGEVEQMKVNTLPQTSLTVFWRSVDMEDRRNVIIKKEQYVDSEEELETDAEEEDYSLADSDERSADISPEISLTSADSRRKEETHVDTKDGANVITEKEWVVDSEERPESDAEEEDYSLADLDERSADVGTEMEALTDKLTALAIELEAVKKKITTKFRQQS